MGLFFGWLAVATGFTAVALVRLARVGRRSPQQGPRAVLLLRPVDAPSAQELENLAVELEGVEQWVVSSFRSSWASGTRWLPSDPPLENRKLGHVQYALETLDTAGRLVLVVDADVRVDDALVDSLLTALVGGAELAWAAPYPVERGAVRGLLVQSLHSFTLLDAMSPGAKPLCGKAMALGPRAQACLRSLPDCVGEDLELSQSLHRMELPVERVGEARMPGKAAPWSAVVARFTRWMQVLKAHRPGLFPTVPVLFACTPVLVAAAALAGSPLGWGWTAGLVGLRAALAAAQERRAGIFVAWFAGELLLLTCWCRALLLGSRITWRGRALRVGRVGALEPRGRAP